MNPVDLLLYIFCFYVFVRFSIALVDGYFLYCLVWLFSIFFGCSFGISADPNFTRCIWFIFTLGIWAGYEYHFLMPRIRMPKVVLISFVAKTLELGRAYSSNTMSRNNRNLLLLLISFLIPFLLSNIGVDSDFQGSIASGSKSSFQYVVRGFIMAFVYYSLYYSAFLFKYIRPWVYRSYMIPLCFSMLFLEFILSFKYLAYLSSYATKLVAPLVLIFSIYYFPFFMWRDIKKLLSRFRLPRFIIVIGTAFAFLVFASLLLALLFGVDGFNLIYLKVFGRSDAYQYFDSETIQALIREYSGNIFYFFHPFLKVLGFQAYDLPMGTFLISGGSTEVVGGPNVHLPVVLYVIFGGGIVGYLSLLVSGFFIGAILRGVKINLIHHFYIKPIPVFWNLFFYINFIILLIEPSAFGHNLFFITLVYCFLALFRISSPYFANE